MNLTANPCGRGRGMLLFYTQHLSTPSHLVLTWVQCYNFSKLYDGKLWICGFVRLTLFNPPRQGGKTWCQLCMLQAVSPRGCSHVRENGSWVEQHEFGSINLMVMISIIVELYYCWETKQVQFTILVVAAAAAVAAAGCVINTSTECCCCCWWWCCCCVHVLLAAAADIFHHVLLL